MKFETTETNPYPSLTESARLTCAIVIATAYRHVPLMRCLEHIGRQNRLPETVIVADGAEVSGVEHLVKKFVNEYPFPIVYYRCKHSGAAVQRNEAAELVTQDVILFVDDDLYMEPECLDALIQVLDMDTEKEIAGVGAILTNQHYRKPSRLFKRWLDFMAGERAESYAGRVIGPAINIYPAPSDDGRVVEVEWLNSGCTAYRRKIFETERFSPKFYGYSMLEDVHLSLRIARHWKLVVASGAQAYHDTQPSHFKHPFTVAKMGVENRYFVMTDVLGRRDLNHLLKFFLLLLSNLFFRLRDVRSLSNLNDFFSACLGTGRGLMSIYLNFNTTSAKKTVPS